MSGRDRPRTVHGAEIMGTHIGIQVIGAAREVEDAVAGCFAELRHVDETFSPYRADSQVSRIADGRLDLDDAGGEVRAVASACVDLESVTDGRFSAWWNRRFDPSGYVKGWAVERAARRHLAPLLERGAEAVGINAGGDVQVFTADDSDWTWRVGIADPRRPDRLAATLELADGAVATSGVAERGAHIVDPRTGMPARGIAAATVVAAGLTLADVWATTAVISGPDDVAWTRTSGIRSAVTVGDDGRVRRWHHGVEIGRFHPPVAA